MTQGSNILLKVTTGSIAGADWEYSISSTRESYNWTTGTEKLDSPSVTIASDKSPGTHYISLRHKPSEHAYFLDQKITIGLATVIEVVDGDTVDVEFPDGRENRMRLLGVDTPESYGDVEPEEWEGIDNEQHLREWGEKAKDYTTYQLLNQEVRLEFDEIAGRVGYYGRLLAYITIDNANYNLELVEKGYARAYTEADCELLEELRAAETQAREARRGVWSALESETPTPDNIHISFVHEDATGDDHNNLNDEYIEITNGSPSSVDMSNWTLSDTGDHVYTFPTGFTLSANSKVTVYTGDGTNTNTELYWDYGSPVWNNGGDTAYLKNSEGSLKDSEGWG